MWIVLKLTHTPYNVTPDCQLLTPADINECKTGSICQYKCKNTPGDYECECQFGYFRNSDNKTCTGTNPHCCWNSWDDPREWPHHNSIISCHSALHCSFYLCFSKSGNFLTILHIYSLFIALHVLYLFDMIHQSP